MKAKLEFDLNDGDDKMSHSRCVKSTDMALVLWELVYNVRKRIEYLIEDGTLSEPDDVIRQYDDELTRLLDEHGINIDDLIN